MKCPVCKTEFHYSQVPLERRHLKAFYALFQCPGCDTWLSPGPTYQRLATWACAILACAGVFGLLGLVGDGLWFLAALGSAVAGAWVFWRAHRRIDCAVCEDA